MSASPTSAEQALDRSRVPAAGELRPFHFPEIQSLQLEGGAPLLFAPSRGFSVATLSVLLPAGGLREGAGQAGLATLTSSLLESGAGARGGSDIADALEHLGVSLQVGTSWDTTQLELTGLRSRMDEAAVILADLLRAPSFPEGEVERIRQEQLAGILQRRAEPRGLANEMAGRLLFADASPFSRPLAGTRATVAPLTRADVVDFHARYYTPRGASLVVAGDLSTEEARTLAQRAAAGWAGEAVPRPVPTAEPRFQEPRVVIVHRAGSVQSEIRVGHVGVSRRTPDYFPLVVMNAILGGAFSSRLNLNLRERHGFTYGVSSSFVMRRDPGPFLVSTAVQTEVTAAALEQILLEIRTIRDTPVSAAELEDARSYVAGTFPLRLQTTEGVASRLTEAALYDLPLDYFDGYRSRVLEVTADDVLRVAREHLRPDRLTTVIVGDADLIRAPLEAAGAGSVEVLDPAGES